MKNCKIKELNCFFKVIWLGNGKAEISLGLKNYIKFHLNIFKLKKNATQ